MARSASERNAARRVTKAASLEQVLIMPRYFFDYFENGELFADDAGVELPDVEAARHEAKTIAAEIGRDYFVDVPRAAYVEVQARDAEGHALFATSVTLTVDGAHVMPIGGAEIERRIDRGEATTVARPKPS